MLTRLSTTEAAFEQQFQRVLDRQPLHGVPEGVADQQTVNQTVQEIIDAVRVGGDQSLFDFTERFDRFRPDPDTVSIPKERWEQAYRRCSDEVRLALEVAHQRISEFHRHQLQSDWEIELPAGTRLGQQIRPLRRVGIYVPGGQAFYPSSLLMNAIPARLAGVEQVFAVTPVPAERLTDAILAAAHLCQIDAIYTIGGAQAIAALAWGTESIPRVDKVVGPGNIYVATAKQKLFGQVDIDMIAGPSEVTIVADQSAKPSHLAADLIAQAEHDKQAVAGVISHSPELFDAIDRELERQLSTLPRQEIARASLTHFGYLVQTRDLDESLALTNRIAPEHLELLIEEPRRYLERVRFAGTVFLGGFSPEAIGDYIAGPNHVLPTGGTARFFSPLGVYDFITRINVVELDRAGFEKLAPHAAVLGREEELVGHSRSVTIRLEEG